MTLNGYRAGLWIKRSGLSPGWNNYVTLTVLLRCFSIPMQVYKRVQAILMLGLTLRWKQGLQKPGYAPAVCATGLTQTLRNQAQNSWKADKFSFNIAMSKYSDVPLSGVAIPSLHNFVRGFELARVTMARMSV